MDEIKDATSEEEIQMIMKEPISADQAEKLEKDISELGADEISELVQNKVLDVVKDESKRQAEDAAFRQELAQRAKDYEDQDNDVLNPGMTNADANDEGRIPTEAEKEDEEDFCVNIGTGIDCRRLCVCQWSGRKSCIKMVGDKCSPKETC